MALLLLAQNVSMVVNNDASILKSIFVLFPLKNRTNNDHVVLLGQLAKHLSGLSVNLLCKLHPRIFFTSAQEERSIPYFLQAKHIDPFKSSQFNYLRDPFHKSAFLFSN